MAKPRFAKLVDRFIIRHGDKFRLKDFDPDDTADLKLTKEAARDVLKDGVNQLRKLQEKLYAQDRWALLLVFQAMDAAGKGGAIEHVMSGVNPQGCEVFSFGRPSEQERDHDFLWRHLVRLPERGRIGIFDRSHYEEVLTVRVHPEILASQKIPSKLVSRHIWKERFKDIRSFESYLARQGYAIRKFFIHISRKEQLQRFTKRLDEPDKNWKFKLDDLKEREMWPQYMDAYEDLIRHTATPDAPWVIVPGNKKWFARLVVAATVINALDELDLHFPKLDASQVRDLKKGRKILESAAK
jgi:PPK2 family polyphosphate:nucleotide phosphotransferase